MRHPAWLMACLLLAAVTRATESGTLDEITVVAAGTSGMRAASAGDVDAAVLMAEPLLRPAALLENIPGLIVTQHSGEGKANQYFLRAFNLDHGTDLSVDVDDMPVNLPSHAHGQGYSDLNFLIPELAHDLHYKKGPYYADEGDFATAGTARIELNSRAPSELELGAGQDGYRRVLAIGSTPLAGGDLLAAGEFYHNDGPFEVPDGYRRLNGVLRYARGDADNFWTLTGMAYDGHWNSTDQVAQRAIDAGLIGRFGSLDPTDGGDSARYSLSFNGVRSGAQDRLQLSAYVIRYRLDLYSNFTYDLKNPVDGDQMLQHDDRTVYGLKSSYTVHSSLFGRPTTNLVGLQARVDDIGDVGIFPTVARQIIGITQDAAVKEASGALYAENSVDWTSRLRSIVGLRFDEFYFDVRDKLAPDPQGSVTGRRSAGIASPKLGLTYAVTADTTLYLNAGYGYHSNDARGVTRSGTNPENPPVTPLTRATSAEIGVTTHPLTRWQTSLDLFKLKLRSELVFDGDAGTTEASGASTRMGVEWGNRFTLLDWLSGDLNAAVTRARFDHASAPDDLGCGDASPAFPCTSVPAISGRYIPNSPTRVIDAGLTAHHPSGWFGALRARHFGPSPLTEDNSVRSPAYITVDAQVGWAWQDHWRLKLDVFNLGGVRWNDIEYYYVSRLPGEAAPRADYVIHPGVPRTLRASVAYFFGSHL